ncbi:MAG: metal ABC transporter permease [Phycisphaerae bacterium]|nr:metal ABC transporter permease [Phycisphaerae bacterium]
MMENMQVILDLFPDAVIAGVVIAAVCAVLGVFVILKRVVFIGIALSEVAACGIAAAMIYDVHPFLGAAVLTLATVVVLSCPFEGNRLPRDAILGIIFVLASATSILLVAKSGFGLEEVKALLYGDLILTSEKDLRIILTTFVPVGLYLLAFIRPTLYTFLDREAARVLGVRVALWELLYFFSLGLAVSAASKVAGALLVFCYLVVSPSTALLLSRRLGVVVVVAALAAIATTAVGLYVSFTQDLPTNQTIATVACLVLGAAVAANLVCRVTARALGR